jgi:pimeloyl-ACP methyl ester carboxylesterase
MLGHGCSTRIACLPDFVKDAESANNYQLGWLQTWFDMVDLPPMFYLHGHSYGGYLSGLYAASNPERIIKLFLNSPAGTEMERQVDYLTLRYVPN